MANKKIEFILDVDKKPIDVAIDSTLNLKQQFRELTKELNKTKEGTKEFELLSTKIGDVKDEMDKTNAKSRDLFGSLSLLPGPVGQFAGSIDNAIGSLKTFTSFSFKDLKFQLGESLNDFKDIASSIGKATGITKIYTTLNNALAKSFVAVGVGEQAAALGAKAFAGALVATGVGAVVVALGFLIEKLMDLVSGEKEAKEASDALNKTLENQKTVADLTAAAISRRNKERLAQLKSQGASEQEIRNEQIRQAKEQLDLARKNEQQARDNYKKDYATASNEDKTKLAKDLDAKKELTRNAASDLRVLEFDNQTAINNEKDKLNQKQIQKNQEYLKKIQEDNQTADKQLLELERANATASISEQRKREDAELSDLKQAEIDKVNSLQISEEKKGKIILQIKKKYAIKQGEVDDKRNKDDIKTKKEFDRKIEDLEIAAIADKEEREKKQREKDVQRKLEDLEEDVEFIKLSETRKAEIRANIIAAGKNVENDIDNKTKQDELDREIKYLQIKGEVMREGTKEFYANRLAILKASEKKELENTELTEKERTAIEQKYRFLREQNAKDEVRAKIQGYSQLFDAIAAVSNALASAYDEEAKKSKEAFEKRKKFQIATAIMSGAAAILNVLAAPPLGNVVVDAIAKGLRILAVGIQTGVQIAQIKKTTFEGSGGASASSAAPQANLGQNYEKGGMIQGKRHAEGGTIIEAEKGEAIMTRGAVTMFGPLLSTLNQMGGGTSFVRSAITTSPDNPTVAQPSAEVSPIIVKSYVVSNEMTTTQEKQARLKNLSTL